MNNFKKPELGWLNSFQQPIFTEILRNRPVCLTIVGGVALQGLLTMIDKPGWQCPLRYGLGCPCPGCGLVRAILSFISGDLKASIQYHAFAPLFLIAIVLVFLSALFPGITQRWLIRPIESLELRTGITAIFLFALVSYWLFRLLFLQSIFWNLIMN